MSNLRRSGSGNTGRDSAGGERRKLAGTIVLGVLLLLCPFAVSEEVRGAEPAGAPDRNLLPILSGIQPSVVQSDGAVTLTFKGPVAVSSVKIGTKDAVMFPQSADKAVVVASVAKDTPTGLQEVAVTVPGSEKALTGTVFVMPAVIGFKAKERSGPQVRSDHTRSLPGGEIVVQFSGPIPAGIRPPDLTIKLGGIEASILDIQNDSVKARVPDTVIGQASYPVQVFVRKAPFGTPLTLTVINASVIYVLASLGLCLLLGLIYLLYRFYRPPPGQKSTTVAEMLLLEQANQTYSLSRAQFLSWLVVIVWSYLVVFFSRGLIEDNWIFPQIGNSAYVFLTSLGTLVIAQATSKGQGYKGAGQVSPSISDFVVYGGVIALDRVQQVVWTVIALCIFLKMTVATCLSATELPGVPPELVALMGLSSASYLGGKLVRGAGPIIEQVSVKQGSVILNMKGRHFSKEAFIWMDGVKQPKEAITRIVEDPDAPQGFAKEMDVTLSLSMEDWRAADHTITIINSDAQRADWRTGPEIVEVTPGEVSPQGKALLTIQGARLSSGAAIGVGGAPDAKPVQDGKNPNLFTVEVDQGWLKTSPHVFTVSSNGEKGAYTYEAARG